ncbi:MAG TPA: gliding motility-associated C-terminal domain-containing protein, partial [Cytophagales bacterium]|nr:gliding motility-associated C-terminal domain-containing protein [Cytophagales bacterium]
TKDSAYVLTIPRPLMNLTHNQPGCEGQALALDATPDTPHTDAIRTWTFNGDTLQETTPILNINQTKYGNGTYVVIYRVEDCISKDTAVVQFHPLPPTSSQDKQFCSITQKTLELKVDFDKSVYDIKWLTALNTVLNPSDTNSTVLVDSSDFPMITEKPFIYELRNDAGCITRDSVVVKDLCDISVHVPSGFTPNGDGTNDKFGVFGLEKYIKSFELYIFNRWGEVIFRTSDFYDAWDGTYREEPMPVGVYPYVITYELKDPAMAGKRKQNGKVTIIK